MGSGFMGKVLWVDLGTGDLSEEIVPEKVYRRYLGGTGLGLAIVRTIVDRHRGDIAVESEPEQGATFRILLPVIDAKELQIEDQRRTDLAGQNPLPARDTIAPPTGLPPSS